MHSHLPGHWHNGVKRRLPSGAEKRARDMWVVQHLCELHIIEKMVFIFEASKNFICEGH